MNSNKQIDSYFIKYHDGPPGIQGDTFYLKGVESYAGIIMKTLDAFEYFKGMQYDFIIRTNLSSLWNFKALIRHLETLPVRGVYSGIIGRDKKSGIQFIAGSGFIMTPDIMNLLLFNRSLAEGCKIIDDVDIGHALDSVGVPFLRGLRTDFYSKPMVDYHVYNPAAYHYRFKWHRGTREEESECMMRILEKITADGVV